MSNLYNLLTLINMGFSQERSERALEATNNIGVEEAIEWILIHADEKILAAVETSAKLEDPNEIAETQSLKWNDSQTVQSKATSKVSPCIQASTVSVNYANTRVQVRLRNGTTISKTFGAHEHLSVVRSWVALEHGNDQPFSFISNFPKRVFTEKEFEKPLLTLGLVPSVTLMVSQILESDDEVQKYMEEPKHVSQEDLAKIEGDKSTPKQRLHLAHNPSKMIPPYQATISRSMSNQVTSNLMTLSLTASDQGAISKNYTNTRVQVRLTDGRILSKTFNVHEKLSAVRLWVQSERSTNQPISFISNFPTKMYTEEDYEKSLLVLDLVPSAMLIVPQDPQKFRIMYSEEDTYDAKREREEMERKKFIEERKRELLEERLAREHVLAQIEDDKAARKMRWESNEAVQQSSTVKNCENTLVQVRLRDGRTFKKTFAAHEKLSMVLLWAQSKENNLPINLMTNGPNKVFTREDYQKSLQVLGLVPSALLFTKATNFG